MSVDNNSRVTEKFLNDRGDSTLKHLLSSEKWKGFFQSFSNATGFDLDIHDENVNKFLTTKDNPICNLIKSSSNSNSECPTSCTSFISESLKLNEPVTYKCYLNVTNFAVPIDYLEEKAVIVGRKGFASYEDFLEFLKIAKDKGIYEVPVKTALHFENEDYVKNISLYVHKTVHYLLHNTRENQRLIEKIRRFTSLADTGILEKVSENIDSACRYIVDTIEFILSEPSVAILVFDKETSVYKTVCATGKYKDNLLALQFNPENTLIKQLLTLKIPVSPVLIEAEKLMPLKTTEEIKSLYFFPIVFDESTDGLIGVLNGKLPREDINIINTLRDYVELAIKNHTLFVATDKKMDEMLTSISDSSISIAPLLNWDSLLQTIVEKSTQLLKAEQGSLMLFDEETTELLVEAKKSLDDIIKENMRVHKGEGIAGKVFENGQPLLVEDVEKDPRINQKNKPRYKTKSFVSIPLNIEGKIIGVLNISDKITGDVFDEKDLRLIQFFATNASLAIDRSLLHEKSEKLRELSVTDPLTGVLNRRYLNDRLSEEISRFNRYKQPFCLLMVDIDEFKKYNDTYGHLIGDRVLKILASTILSSLRNIDKAARFGGDEFVLILPQTPKVDAINIANRIKENVEKIFLSHSEELPFTDLTVSIGLASYPEDASSAAELLDKTDQALYLAKKGGKNRLVYL